MQPTSRSARPLARRLLLPLLAVLLLAGAAPASAEEDSPYGINVHVPQGEELRLLLDRAEAAGIGWIRIDFVWAFVEPRQDEFGWAVYDAIAAAAQARGIEVFATLAYTPAWATSGPESIGPPANPADWADFCFRAARRYRDTIRHWGLWNEPNLDHFWAGTRRQYIEDILKRGADAVHAGNPQALVGGPELAHLTSGDSDWYDWLLESLEEAGDRLDFVTHHVYDGDGPGDVTEKLDRSTVFGNVPELWDSVAPSVREVLEEAGWSGPFWLTETGWATDRVSEARQASNYTGLLGDWFAGRPGRDWVDKVFFYEIKDAPASFDVPLWGILRVDFSPKPAWAAYRDFIAAHPPVSGPPPVPAQPLPLLDGRFQVTVRWRDHQGRTGAGVGVPGTDQTGTFWFFDPSNTELVVKLIDGGPVNGKLWFFYGALSDVEYWIEVFDVATFELRQYHNPPGTLCGQADTSAFASSSSALASSPAPALSPLPQDAAAGCGGDALCLVGDRFRVEVDWRIPGGRTGRGTAVPGTDPTGTFWFFNPANVELVVKILDARAVNGRFWFFYGALSDVDYQVTVTDTATGVQRTYRNAQGNLCGRADTMAF